MKLLSKTSIGFLAATTLLMGCGKDSVKNATETAKNTVRAHQIMGTWESECSESKILSASMKDYYKFSGNTYIKSTEYFQKDDCTEPSVKSQYEGTFKVADSNDRNEDARNINIELTKVTLVPLTEGGVKLLGMVNFCGISEWQIGRKQDLTAQSTATLCAMDDVPQKRYDIAQVEDKKLFMGVGDRSAMNTIEARPVELDRESPYVESKHEITD